MAHTNFHDPSHVYSSRELPLTQLPVDDTIDTLQVLLTNFFPIPEDDRSRNFIVTANTCSASHVNATRRLVI